MFKDIALVLHLMKEIPPTSKFTFNRFPKKQNSKFNFDPKSEKNIDKEFNHKRKNWQYPDWK